MLGGLDGSRGWQGRAGQDRAASGGLCITLGLGETGQDLVSLVSCRSGSF